MKWSPFVGPSPLEMWQDVKSFTFLEHSPIVIIIFGGAAMIHWLHFVFTS